MRRRRRKKKPIPVETRPELLLILPAHIPAIWPVAGPLVEQGLNDLSIGELYQLCLTGMGQLWVVFSDKMEAAGVTTLTQTSDGLVLEIRAFAGSGMTEWWNTQDEMYEWARQQGCRSARLHGRKGWERTLQDKGWRFLYVTLEKDLSNGL